MDGAHISQSEKPWELTLKAQLIAQLEEVWDVVSDFVHVDRWIPDLTSRLGPGPGVLRIVAACGHENSCSYERLVNLDTDNHCIAYTVEVSPMKLKGYRAEIKLTHGDQPGTTLVSWSYKMPPNAETSEEKVARTIEPIWRKGFEGLTALFQRPDVDGSSSPGTEKQGGDA